MSTLDNLRSDVVSRLQVTSQILTKIGAKINVGENFTARFTVRNTDTALTFQNVRLQVTMTESAVPVDGPELTRNLASELEPGCGAQTDVQFEALKAADRLIPPDVSPSGKPIWMIVNETFARLQVFASVKTAAFLGELTKATLATADIRPAPVPD